MAANLAQSGAHALFRDSTGHRPVGILFLYTGKKSGLFSTPMQDSQGAARRLERPVREDLAGKMVFVAGPRQCGKTTLVRRIAAGRKHAYFDWEAPAHRRALRAGELPQAAELWIFDELHKLSRWRNWLEGVYDLDGREHAILVMGSARLDAYGRGGDSLQGRYVMHRLHPFTLSELLALPFADDIDALPALELTNPSGAIDAIDRLMRFGGFPEPVLGGSERRAARWRRTYGERLVRGDVRDLELLRDLDTVEMLYDRLPDLVGSVLSINALREDLEVAFGTVRSWLLVLERLYGLFRVSPLGVPGVKAVKKEQKLYLWDWARVPAEAARFENLVLSHLLRLVHWLVDEHGERAELRYFRTTAGHEVDAVIVRGGKPWMALEAKMDDRPLDSGLKYLLQRARIPYAFQVSLRGNVDSREPDINGCRVRRVPAARFLANLP